MSSIVEKISKLNAMAKSAASIGNQAEAEAFAAKVAALLRDHKLTMSEVEYEAQAKEDPFTHKVVERKGTNSTPVWRLKLARAIAESMFCTYLYSEGISRITFVGRTSDVDAVIALFNSLADTAKKLGAKACKGSGMKVSHPMRRTFMQSFVLGFADGVASRLYQERIHLPVAQQDNALMRRDSLLLKEYTLQALRPTAGKTRTAPVGVSSAYAQGKSAGSSVSLNQRARLGAGN